MADGRVEAQGSLILSRSQPHPHHRLVSSPPPPSEPSSAAGVELAAETGKFLGFAHFEGVENKQALLCRPSHNCAAGALAASAAHSFHLYFDIFVAHMMAEGRAAADRAVAPLSFVLTDGRPSQRL